MKLGLQLGYWPAMPPPQHADLVAAAEASGFDAIFTAESWGSDCFTPLAWYGSSTRRVRLGTAVAQISARTPASTAMHALTLDHLSGGRAILGLGVSGPQVVEGWYGQNFAKPLSRTREYVAILRDIWERKHALTAAGPWYPLPLSGPESTGLGKPLKSIVHPLRAELPVWLGAEGEKNVMLTAEIADGWLATFFSLSMAPTYNEWLDAGFARQGSRRTRDNFEVAAGVQVIVTDDVRSALDSLKPTAALYVGGMGAQEVNFHARVYRRMGYGAVVDEVTALFLAGRRDAAAAAIPDEMVRETAIVGTKDQVRGQISQWEAAGVTMLMVSPNTTQEIYSIAGLLDPPA